MQMSGLVFNRLNPRKLREVEKKPTVSTAVRKQPAAFITSNVLLLTVWGGGGVPTQTMPIIVRFLVNEAVSLRVFFSSFQF